jgi:outer membrane protein OmpA-like peptidoglycan-associated protein
MKNLYPFLITVIMASAPVWAEEDVQLYKTAPSVEELARQLSGSSTSSDQIGTSPSATNKRRTRAIVFDNGSSEASQPRQQQRQESSHAQGGGKVLAFPIYFPSGSYSITDRAMPFIESVGNLMKMDPSVKFQVEGHTDSVGSSSSNLELSRKRANAVTDYLINQYRIDSSRLVPVGKGSQEPLRGMSPRDPTNRRVQFRTLG